MVYLRRWFTVSVYALPHVVTPLVVLFHLTSVILTDENVADETRFTRET